MQDLSAEMRWAGPFGFLVFSIDGVDVASAGVVRSPSGITVNALTVREEYRGTQIGHTAFHLIADIFSDYLSDPVEIEWVGNTLVCGNLSVVASVGFRPAVDAWAKEVQERINANPRLLSQRSGPKVTERQAFASEEMASLASKNARENRKA